MGGSRSRVDHPKRDTCVPKSCCSEKSVGGAPIVSFTARLLPIHVALSSDFVYAQEVLACIRHDGKSNRVIVVKCETSCSQWLVAENSCHRLNSFAMWTPSTKSGSWLDMY